MENGIFRILPTLITKPAITVTHVFDKPVSIEVTIFIDPLKCQFDSWPKLCDELLICRALVIATGEHNKKRRRVDRTVIKTKWNLPQRCHFSAPLFVKNLAGVGISGRVRFRSLM